MNRTFSLPDGRILCYAEYGIKGGEPLFYFHGFPGSHLEVNLFQGERVATELKIHLIAIDRPGYGGSEGQKHRTLRDWSKDVTDLADGLEWEKFSVLGYSGGGPFALACARWIPERLNKILVISGMGPVTAPLIREAPLWALLRGPALMRSMILMGMKRMLNKDPEKILINMNKDLPRADKEMMNKDEIKANFIALLKESFRLSLKGAMQDASILRGDWGFSLDQVLPAIDLWHGEQDENVKIETARYMAGGLPNCATHYYPDEGHISLITNHIEKILKLQS